MKLDWKTCFRVGVTAFLLFLCVYYWDAAAYFLALFVGALRPLLIGCVIAYLLNILMSFYERRCFPQAPRWAKLRRPVCMLAAIVTLVGIVFLVIRLIIPELAASIRLLMSYLPSSIDWLAENASLMGILPEDLRASLSALSAADWQSMLSKAVQFLSSGISGAVGTVAGAVSSLFSLTVSFFVGLIFAVYLLMGRDKLARQGLRLMDCYLPSRWKERTLYVLRVVNNCFHRYVVGQCIEAVILGVLCTLGMLLLRLPYATMTGALIGFTALIPIAGAYIGAGVGAFMILTVSPLQALLFLLFIVVLQQVEGNLIYPRVVGSSIGLPGIWVLAAVAVGGSLLGVLGMLLGVPLAAAVYQLLRADMRKRAGLPE